MIISRVIAAGVIGLLLLIPQPEVSANAAGWLIAWSSLTDLVTVLAIAAACLIVGGFLTRFDSIQRISGALALTMSLVIGSGVLGALLMIQGLLGLFTPGAVRVGTLLLVFGVASRGALGFVRSSWHSMRSELAQMWADPSARVPMCVAAAGLIYLMLTAMGPTTSWDGPMYHVDLPREFLREGRIFLPPDNHHVAFIGSPQMLNAVFLASGAEAGPALMQWVWLAASLLLMSTVVSRWVSPLAGSLTLVLVWAYPLLPLVGSWDLADTAMATAVFVGTLVGLHWLEEKRQPDGVVLGFLVGGVMATKPQAALFVIGLAVTVVLGSRLLGQRILFGPLVVGALVALVVWGPTLVKNAMLIGEPFFPVFSDPFVPAWVYEVDPRFEVATPTRILREVRLDFNLRKWVFDPGALTPEATGRWYGFPLIFVLGLGAFLTKERRQMILLAAPAVIGVLLVVVIQGRTNLRYLIPVAPVAVVSLAVLLGSLTSRARESLRPMGVVLIVVVSLVLASQWVRDVTLPSGRAIAAMGIISDDEWLNRPANVSERQAVMLGQEIRQLGASEEHPALLLYEGRGDLIEAPVLQDNVFQNSTILMSVVGSSCPQDTSWNLLVRSTATLEYLRQRGASDETLMLDRFNEFAQRCLTQVAEVEGYEIYRRVE